MLYFSTHILNFDFYLNFANRPKLWAENSDIAPVFSGQVGGDMVTLVWCRVLQTKCYEWTVWTLDT